MQLLLGLVCTVLVQLSGGRKRKDWVKVNYRIIAALFSAVKFIIVIICTIGYISKSIQLCMM